MKAVRRVLEFGLMPALGGRLPQMVLKMVPLILWKISACIGESVGQGRSISGHTPPARLSGSGRTAGGVEQKSFRQCCDWQTVLHMDIVRNSAVLARRV